MAALAMGCASPPTGHYDFQQDSAKKVEPEVELARAACTAELGDRAAFPWYAGPFSLFVWQNAKQQHAARYQACMRLQGWKFIEGA